MNNEIVAWTSVEEWCSALERAIEGAANSIVEMANLYVAGIDQNPKWADIIKDRMSAVVPPRCWAQYEAIGRKWVHPQLVIGTGSRNDAKLKRLAYSLQERIFTGERFELLTADGGTLLVDLRELDVGQIDQMIDGSEIRTLSAQKVYLESLRMKQVREEEPEAGLPYRVVGKGRSLRVVFDKKTSLTRDELRRLALEVS